MESLLLVLTILSLVVAIAMSLVAWRAARDEKRRAAAREAAIFAASVKAWVSAPGSARPWPTMSYAVPWAGVVKTVFRPAVTVTPLGTTMGFRPRRDMAYQTSQMSSPPRPAFRAARSVISPLDVVSTEMPRPDWTLGTSSLPT